MRLNEVRVSSVIQTVKNMKYETWVKRVVDGTYKIHSDGTVDVEGDVNIENMDTMEYLPAKFGKVSGVFSIQDCDALINLTGCPTSCKKFLIGVASNLISIKEMRNTKIEGDVMIHNCGDLETLDGCPPIILGDLDISECTSLTSLHRGPKTVRGDFCMDNCEKILNLLGGPTLVGGTYSCRETFLESFEGIPEILHANLNAEGSNFIKTFKFLPKQMNGEFDIGVPHNTMNLLQLFKVKGMTQFLTEDRELEHIINKHLKNKDVMSAQEELLEAGYGKRATF